MPKIGVISDTHGLVRDDICRNLQDVELIIHAGDVGGQSVLDQFNSIAPVIAVRGNVDRGEFAQKLPLTDVVVRNCTISSKSTV